MRGLAGAFVPATRCGRLPFSVCKNFHVLQVGPCDAIYYAPQLRCSEVWKKALISQTRCTRESTSFILEEKMDEYLKEALEIVKAQASVRNMTEEEILSMVDKLAKGIANIHHAAEEGEADKPAIDPKKAIREKSIVCLECGKSFKVLTKRHLATHGLTPVEYKEKYGYTKKTSLVCKSLARERRKKMADMRLWERRGQSKTQE
jgi:predicted transcriptional regulator